LAKPLKFKEGNYVSKEDIKKRLQSVITNFITPIIKAKTINPQIISFRFTIETKNLIEMYETMNIKTLEDLRLIKSIYLEKNNDVKT